jgi:hypothetical protein
MAIGLDSLTFQYYHLRVLLARHEESDRESCLHSAREALMILPKLVSTSEQVYNGVVWYVQSFRFCTTFSISKAIDSKHPNL